MDTGSLQFLAFGLAVALVSNFSRRRIWREIVLMTASAVFLGLLAHQLRILLPLAGFLLIGYIGVYILQRGWLRAQVWSILVVLLLYAWLKKYTFLPHGVFLSAPYFTVGLSYIFFRVLHLQIETADRKGILRVSPFAYLLYTLNFTTLISGPIQRYDEFHRDQFANEPIPLGPRVIGMQIERIIRGFFKINVVAMVLHSFQMDAVEQLTHPYATIQIRLWAAFCLAVVYPFFLYANFSGYIDIVIAIARLMRVRLPENFDRPFSSTSFIDFWNRWHITLSTWLKNYVYNPLLMALMRRIESPGLQPLLGVLSFFVTFFLVGVWHGRTSEFIFFGILQGGGVAINKLWQIFLTGRLGRKEYKALAANSVYASFSRGLTFAWFAFTLFWFWADWKQIDRYFSAIGTGDWLVILIAVVLSATAVLSLWEWLRATLLSIRGIEGPVLNSRYARVVYSSALGLIALFLTIFLNQPSPDIVYKAF
jgi:D-alanyl-lipoteichoic acid acyltransferase DltB (MBOAT superfamily)